MEISPLTPSSSIEFETEKDSLEPFSKASKGIASIPDTIDFPSTPPKPNCLVRAAISVTLVLFHLATWTFQFTYWIIKNLFASERLQEILYQKLHYLCKEGDLQTIRQFLTDHANEPFAAGYFFSEFINLPELHVHLSEILQGANVCIVGDRGFFSRRWSNHPDCYSRVSSHNYKQDRCFAIGQFIFWEDLNGHTRFQFESSPLRGFFGWINHTIDFLRYQRDNEQQGVVGTSLYTEEYCLKVPINPSDFLSRKVN